MACIGLTFCVGQIERQYGVHPYWLDLGWICQAVIIVILVGAYSTLLGAIRGDS